MSFLFTAEEVIVLANVEFEVKNSQLKIYISGEIDHHSAFSIKDIIDAQILKVSPRTAVMNFEKVTFMDSSGIGLILARYRFCQNCGTSLYVQGLNSQTQKVLNLAGIKTIKEIIN
ncbi:MAG: anti-sigma factor antagonist [Oscillospiraceae bacterium]|nr:anti-sigma factor antagonist [Oscillospiraceae bacterium]MBR2502553.1 anti-sigma factor antagonist [Oscillospiraceae bacterium]